jgi:hypothetical protein
MDLIGWVVMRPPILWLSLVFFFVIFTGPSCFLLRSLLFLSRGSLGEASRGFILRLLSFTSLLLPSGLLAPSSNEIRCSPENRSTQCPDKWNGISEWEAR